MTSEDLPGFNVNVPFLGSASANWKKRSDLGDFSLNTPWGSAGANWKRKGDFGLKGDIESGA